MYITRIREVFPKNLQSVNGRTDSELLTAYKKQLDNEGITYTDNGKSVVVIQYLSAYTGIDFVLRTDFTLNKTNALDVDAAIADRLLKHRYAVGGNSDWKAIKEA